MILHEGYLERITNHLSKETVALMSKNHVGAMLGPAGGFGLGFGSDS